LMTWHSITYCRNFAAVNLEKFFHIVNWLDM
jgi:hypothetical protein